MREEPPPELEGARRFLLLVDRKIGRGLGLTFYDTDEDMRRRNEALSAMSPEGVRRTSVELYEVAIDKRY